MIGRSIYLRDRAAFTGGSPQAIYEELRSRDRRNRLRNRGIMSGLALVIGAVGVSPLFGVILAVVVAAVDTGRDWWGYSRASVWRRGLRGEERIARLLRLTLERRGYRVLHSRMVPGHGQVDQLLIGPTGVWLIDNQAWHPDAELAEHGGHLFIDGKTPSKMVKGLNASADAIGYLLSERIGTDVLVRPLLAVHGGRIRRGPLNADGIAILRPLQLVRWPDRHPFTEHTPKQVEYIMRAAIQVLPIGGRMMVDED
ncbi:NERD domain-containing protein [Actinomadura craniellae]|uniref:NERD domain-containing protein n=1 Tax=Actinomadura craniellae TaxID=2231787 RepID=A0A365HC17_9ACTN|nr:nuclease-related domain-containing protein [Actinomadura craniellae]RAY16660.1 NERD domain-containing protein [Actinomadura craniellae]